MKQGIRNESIIKDAITAIYNEQYIFERLPHDIVEVGKEEISLALFLIKITNIEAVANTFNGNMRERVIKEIARLAIIEPT
jgi:GGDEF domain-containing protein